MEEGRSDFNILTGKPIGKRALEIPTCRCEDNIRVFHNEIGINRKNWVKSVENRDYWRALVPQAMELVN